MSNLIESSVDADEYERFVSVFEQLVRREVQPRIGVLACISTQFLALIQANELLRFSWAPQQDHVECNATASDNSLVHAAAGPAATAEEPQGAQPFARTGSNPAGPVGLSLSPLEVLRDLLWEAASKYQTAPDDLKAELSDVVQAIMDVLVRLRPSATMLGLFRPVFDPVESQSAGEGTGAAVGAVGPLARGQPTLISGLAAPLFFMDGILPRDQLHHAYRFWMYAGKATANGATYLQYVDKVNDNAELKKRWPKWERFFINLLESSIKQQQEEATAAAPSSVRGQLANETMVVGADGGGAHLNTVTTGSAAAPATSTRSSCPRETVASSTSPAPATEADGNVAASSSTDARTVHVSAANGSSLRKRRNSESALADASASSAAGRGAASAEGNGAAAAARAAAVRGEHWTPGKPKYRCVSWKDQNQNFRFYSGQLRINTNRKYSSVLEAEEHFESLLRQNLVHQESFKDFWRAGYPGDEEAARQDPSRRSVRARVQGSAAASAAQCAGGVALAAGPAGSHTSDAHAGATGGGGDHAPTFDDALVSMSAAASSGSASSDQMVLTDLLDRAASSVTAQSLPSPFSTCERKPLPTAAPHPGSTAAAASFQPSAPAAAALAVPRRPTADTARRPLATSAMVQSALRTYGLPLTNGGAVPSAAAADAAAAVHERSAAAATNHQILHGIGHMSGLPVATVQSPVLVRTVPVPVLPPARAPAPATSDLRVRAPVGGPTLQAAVPSSSAASSKADSSAPPRAVQFSYENLARASSITFAYEKLDADARGEDQLAGRASEERNAGSGHGVNADRSGHADHVDFDETGGFELLGNAFNGYPSLDDSSSALPFAGGSRSAAARLSHFEGRAADVTGFGAGAEPDHAAAANAAPVRYTVPTRGDYNLLLTAAMCIARHAGQELVVGGGKIVTQVIRAGPVLSHVKVQELEATALALNLPGLAVTFVSMPSATNHPRAEWRIVDPAAVLNALSSAAAALREPPPIELQQLLRSVLSQLPDQRAHLGSAGDGAGDAGAGAAPRPMRWSMQDLNWMKQVVDIVCTAPGLMADGDRICRELDRRRLTYNRWYARIVDAKLPGLTVHHVRFGRRVATLEHDGGMQRALQAISEAEACINAELQAAGTPAPSIRAGMPAVALSAASPAVPSGVHSAASTLPSSSFIPRHGADHQANLSFEHAEHVLMPQALHFDFDASPPPPPGQDLGRTADEASSGASAVQQWPVDALGRAFASTAGTQPAGIPSTAAGSIPAALPSMPILHHPRTAAIRVPPQPRLLHDEWEAASAPPTQTSLNSAAAPVSRFTMRASLQWPNKAAATPGAASITHAATGSAGTSSSASAADSGSASKSAASNSNSSGGDSSSAAFNNHEPNTSRHVHVSNIARSTTAQQLHAALVRGFGPPASIKLLPDRSDRSNGGTVHAWVTFQKAAHAAKAVAARTYKFRDQAQPVRIEYDSRHHDEPGFGEPLQLSAALEAVLRAGREAAPSKPTATPSVCLLPVRVQLKSATVADRRAVAKDVREINAMHNLQTAAALLDTYDPAADYDFASAYEAALERVSQAEDAAGASAAGAAPATQPFVSLQSDDSTAVAEQARVAELVAGFDDGDGAHGLGVQKRLVEAGLAHPALLTGAREFDACSQPDLIPAALVNEPWAQERRQTGAASSHDGSHARDRGHGEIGSVGGAGHHNAPRDSEDHGDHASRGRRHAGSPMPPSRDRDRRHRSGYSRSRSPRRRDREIMSRGHGSPQGRPFHADTRFPAMRQVLGPHIARRDADGWGGSGVPLHHGYVPSRDGPSPGTGSDHGHRGRHRR